MAQIWNSSRLGPDAALPSINEVQVWIWHCRFAATHDSHLAVLSNAERGRAARFAFERDRARFAAAHAGLRHVLGGLLGIAPAAITMITDAHGKPRLAGPARPPVFFNLSHSDDLAALAVSSAFDIGIDIERVRDMDPNDVAPFLSVAEQAALMRLPGAARRLGIFHAWTRKEAYLKAIGVGLAAPLDQFDVSIAPDEPARILRVAGAPAEASAWWLVSITPAPGYVGAVAARAQGWHVTCHNLELAA